MEKQKEKTPEQIYYDVYDKYLLEKKMCARNLFHSDYVAIAVIAMKLFKDNYGR